MLLRRDGIDEELAQAARATLAKAWGPAQLRALGDGNVYASAGWQAVVDTGWLDLLVPEANGGLGLGPVAAGAVFEEAGRALLPGPLFATMVVGAAGRAAGVVDAGALVALAGVQPAGDMHVEGDTVSGRAPVVEYGDCVDVVVAAATSPAGEPVVVVVAADGPRVTTSPLVSIDAASRYADVMLDQAPVAGVLATGAAAQELLASFETAAHVLYAARLLGVADRLLELAVDFARERRQFDRPIGSFQAVQHLLADALVRTWIGRSAAYTAQAALAEGRTDGAHLARVAKGYLSIVGRHVAETALQVHGGIGFAEDHDLHLFYKHALALQAAWGDERAHQDQLAAELMQRVQTAHVSE